MTLMQFRENEAPHAGMADVLLELGDRLETARQRYDELVEWRSAESASVVFASDQRLSLQPLHYERNGWRPGRLLKNRPASGDYVEDFFDHVDRWIATCEHTVAGGLAFYEEFFERAGSTLDGTRFDYYEPDKKPIDTTHASFDGDLIVNHATRRENAWWYEIYRRDDSGRIVAIECVQFQPFYNEQLATSVDLIDYHPDGAVQTIRKRWESGENELLYRRD
jgi:hypothetical protein